MIQTCLLENFDLQIVLTKPVFALLMIFEMNFLNRPLLYLRESQQAPAALRRQHSSLNILHLALVLLHRRRHIESLHQCCQ